MRYFETRFLEEADKFVSKLDKKSAKKVFYNIDIAEQTNDPKLFKKLKGEIWEFRSQFMGNQNRLLAFWDKTDKVETFVLKPSFWRHTDLLRKTKKFHKKRLTKQNELDKNISTIKNQNNDGKERNKELFTCRNER